MDNNIHPGDRGENNKVEKIRNKPPTKRKGENSNYNKNSCRFKCLTIPGKKTEVVDDVVKTFYYIVDRRQFMHISRMSSTQSVCHAIIYPVKSCFQYF